MARPVALKYVVTFSSQDDAHSVQNLLKDGCYKKWLSNPKDRSGTMEAVFQLEKSCILSYLDIGTHWCSNLSVFVGKSEWPQSRQFEPLIRDTCLMTLADVRLGRNSINTKMFTTSDFCSDAATSMWDRIRVVCRQNFPKKVQFGLTFLRIKASKVEESSVSVGLTDNQFARSKDLICEKNPKSMNEKIQNHFFKEKQSKSPGCHLETQLLKIASTSDNGTNRVEGLSRTAHILKAAQGNAGKYTPKYCKPSPKTSGKKSFFAELISQNKSPLLKGENGKAEENLNSKQKNIQNVPSKGNRAKSPVSDLFSPVADQLGGDLSRMAQMLKAAQENAGKYAPSKRYETSPNSSRKSLFFSEMKAQKESLSFEEEIDEFLSKLEIKPEDLESITIADLRHRFERKKKRKLTKEERKLYVEKVSDHISKIFSQSSQNQDEDIQQTKRMRIEPPTSTSHSGRNLQKHRDGNQQSFLSRENRKRKIDEDFNDDLVDPNINHRKRNSTEFGIHFTESKTNRFENTNPREVTPISAVTSPNRSLQNDDVQFDLELAELENRMCPLCGESFPVDVIEMHADICADSQQFDLHYS